MNGYRYIDQQGHEKTIANAKEVARLVAGGEVGADTMLFDSTSGTWQPAASTSVYQAATAVLELGPADAGHQAMNISRPVARHEPAGQALPDVAGVQLGSFAGHAWQGKLFIALGYGAAALFAISTTTVLPLLETDAAAAFAGFTVVGGVAAFTFFLARSVARFWKWSWWFVMLTQTLTLVGIPFTIWDSSESPSAKIAAALWVTFAAVFLHYFWTRRGQFG